MSVLYERIRQRREELGLTQDELAARLSYRSRSTIAKIESGCNDIPQSKIEAFARALSTTTAYLMGWSDDAAAPLPDRVTNLFPVSLKRIPMLGSIACGEPIFCDQEREQYVMASADLRADFCLKAQGDSMVGARIYDGDIVFIRQQPMVDNGEIAAVVIDNEATLKRVYYDRSHNKLVLNPENPAYAPLVYTGEELSQIRILGKAVCFMSTVR